MAVPFLRGLHGADWPIDLVVSRADTRRRRNADPEPSPVKAAALELGMAVSDDPADVAGSGADLGIVVAYGRIIKPDLLAQVPMVNVHFSHLPRWRGAAPVERAILAGDETTGVDIMAVEEGLDTGGLYSRHQTDIGEYESASELAHRLVGLGVPLLLDTLRMGLRDPQPQEGEPTYAEKIQPDELRIDWLRSTIEIHRLVRLERAWTTFRGKRLKVLAGHPLPGSLEPGIMDLGLPVEVGTGQGTFRLDTVQPEGKAPMKAKEWAQGARIEPGERLGDGDG
jgi:methionyl-tRNA formyltransferase